MFMSSRKEGYMKKAFMVSIGFLCLIFSTHLASGESITTTDGKTIDFDYYAPSGEKAPLVILVPDTRCDRSVFRKLPRQLNKAGFAVIATDLRYKTLISAARSRQEAVSALQAQDLYAPVRYDMKSIIEYARQKKEIDPKRIALLGTSFGSRVALHAGIEHGVASLVLVSLSGSNPLPRDKGAQQLLEEYGDKPILFQVSEKDWGNDYKAAEDNKKYAGWGKGKRDLKVWKGSDHGADIVEDKEPSIFTIEWLKSNL